MRTATKGICVALAMTLAAHLAHAGKWETQAIGDGAEGDAAFADDEITVASTDVRERAVHCVHCRTVTTAAVELSEVLPCSGCGRNLLVYYHVSRRQGAHLGYMVDAEEQSAS